MQLIVTIGGVSAPIADSWTYNIWGEQEEYSAVPPIVKITGLTIKIIILILLDFWTLTKKLA